MRIVYADRDLAVVLKPIGALSEDSGKGSAPDTASVSVPALLREAQGKPDAYIGTVHRLDKNVGGLMVYSLDPKMTGKLSAALQEEGAGKEYLAVLRGVPPEREGILCDLLYHDRGKNKTYVVGRKRNGVKEARLSYRVENTVALEDEVRTLVSVRLMTGRTHQIRVQFASRSLPLVGDARYGGGKGDPMLFSHRLTFTHPRTGKPLTFEATPEGEAWRAMLQE